MSKEPDWPHLDLPWGGPRRVKSAVLHVVAVAEYVMTYTRGWAVDSPIRRLRLKAENARLRQEVALLSHIAGLTGADLAQQPDIAAQLSRACQMLKDHILSPDSVSHLTGRLKRRVVLD